MKSLINDLSLGVLVLVLCADAVVAAKMLAVTSVTVTMAIIATAT
jgi:hypothetical protein